MLTDINGYTLTSYADAADVLWDDDYGGETQYSVTVDCIFSCPSSYPKTRDYELDYP